MTTPKQQMAGLDDAAFLAEIAHPEYGKMPQGRTM